MGWLEGGVEERREIGKGGGGGGRGSVIVGVLAVAGMQLSHCSLSGGCSAEVSKSKHQ